MNGALLFAKYAFAPNRLRYCGPDENKEIFDYVVNKKVDLGLIELLSKFEGAYPYLKLIAISNKIPNPFDYRVVEAYWLGNNLLDKVETKNLYDNLKTRFKKGINLKDWQWLIERINLSPQPNHTFHVFEIYRRFGLIRSGQSHRILETLDKCRISWGKIIKISKPFLVVESQSLIFKDKKIVLGEPINKKITYELFNKSFLKNTKIDKYVSIHWDWACDILSKRQKMNLEKYTQKYLNLANLTI